MQAHNPAYEYRTNFAVIQPDFPNHDRLRDDFARIAPKPPRGEEWQLVSSTPVLTSEGMVVLYFWERPARQQD